MAAINAGKNPLIVCHSDATVNHGGRAYDSVKRVAPIVSHNLAQP